MGVFGYDLTDPVLYDSGFPHKVFTGIRRDCPVAWHDPAADGTVSDGFWSVAGYREVLQVFESGQALSPPSPTLVADAAGLVVLELARRPDLWAAVRASGIEAGLDELARWVCPQATVWCRATEEMALGRHRIAPGERLACWLPSANRDEAVFGRDAMDFVLDRHPNPHLSFYRMPEAREWLATALTELLADVDRLVLTGEPEWVRSMDRSALVMVPVELEHRPPA